MSAAVCDRRNQEKNDARRAPLQNQMQITVGIVTISDRASAGEYADLGGPAVKKFAEEAGWQVLAEAVVPDDAKRIQETLRSFSKQGCGLDSDHRRHRNRETRCYAGSDSCDHAPGNSGVRGNHARAIDENHAERDFVAQPRRNCRSIARDRPARQTERRSRMPRIRHGRNPARGCERAGHANLVLG